MATQEAQAEPSMEEILASIRRIISEEDQPAAKAEPVLELTQPAADQPPPEDDLLVFEDEKKAVAAAPVPAPTPTPAPPVAAAPQPAPVAAAAPPPARVVEITPPVSTEGPIVSEPAATMAASSFTKLVGSIRVSETAGQTLEGMIRLLVRPLLKEWLDENLPAIVEAKVEAELERIARMSR